MSSPSAHALRATLGVLLAGTPTEHPHLTSAQLDALFASGRMFVIQRHDAANAGLHYDLRLEFKGTLKSWAVKRGFTEDPGTIRLAVETTDHDLGYGKFEGSIPEGFYGAGSVQIWDMGYFELVDKDGEARRANDSGSDSEPSDTEQAGEGAGGKKFKGSVEIGKPGDYNRKKHARILQQQWDGKKLSIIFHGQRMKGRWALWRADAPTNWRRKGSYGGFNKIKYANGEAEGSQWLLKKKKVPGGKTYKKGDPQAELCEKPESARSVLTGRTVAEIVEQESRNWVHIRKLQIFQGLHIDGGPASKDEAKMFQGVQNVPDMGDGSLDSDDEEGGFASAVSRAGSKSTSPLSNPSSPKFPGQGHKLGNGFSSSLSPQQQQPESPGRPAAPTASALLLIRQKRRAKRMDYDTDESEEEREIERRKNKKR